MVQRTKARDLLFDHEDSVLFRSLSRTLVRHRCKRLTRSSVVEKFSYLKKTTHFAKQTDTAGSSRSALIDCASESNIFCYTCSARMFSKLCSNYACF